MTSSPSQVRIAKIPHLPFPVATRLFAIAAACAVLAWGPIDAGAQETPSAAEFAAISSHLPPLDREDGVVDIPLATPGEQGGFAPIRDGVEISTRAPLSVGYRLRPGTPAGVARVLPAGALAGLETITLRGRADRNVRLTVTLQDGQGAVFSLGSVTLGAGPAREHVLSLGDAAYFAPQSTAPDPGTFKAQDAVLLTLLDIAGFTTDATPEVAWTIERLEGAE
ncbi:MAG: hypothetical protein AAGN46_02130 [Acidobacteriota bacterium]